MAFKIFKPDNPLMITMTQITDVIFLSVFWFLGCIPVVTAGASFAALYDSVCRTFRKGEKNSWSRFWNVYGREWKASILPTVTFYVLLWAVLRLVISFWNRAVAGAVTWAVFSAVGFVGVVLLGVLSVLFPTLSRFENRFGRLLKNALLLALANLPRTVALGFVNAVTIFMCAKWVVPLFFMPALAALIGTLFLEPMFKPYMPEEDEEPEYNDAAE